MLFFFLHSHHGHVVTVSLSVLWDSVPSYFTYLFHPSSQHFVNIQRCGFYEFLSKDIDFEFFCRSFVVFAVLFITRTSN